MGRHVATGTASTQKTLPASRGQFGAAVSDLVTGNPHHVGG